MKACVMQVFPRRKVNFTFLSICIICSCLALGINVQDSAYDKVVNIFNPQGCLIQSEYAKEAVKKGATCIGVRCKDGVVIAIRKRTQEKSPNLIPQKSLRRIYRISKSIGFLPAGISSDGRALAYRTLDIYKQHKMAFGDSICGRVLAEQIGAFLHKGSLQWASRQLASVVLIACPSENIQGNGEDLNSVELWVVDTSGFVQEFNAYCIGQDSDDIFSKWQESEFKFDKFDCQDVMKEVCRIFEKDREGVQWEIALVKISKTGEHVFEHISDDKVLEWTK